MGRCVRCNRPLKDPTATIGPECAGRPKKMKLRHLGSRPDGTRSYLIQDGAFQRTVRIQERDGGRFAECECQSSANERCEHIQMAAPVDATLRERR